MLRALVRSGMVMGGMWALRRFLDSRSSAGGVSQRSSGKRVPAGGAAGPGMSNVFEAVEAGFRAAADVLRTTDRKQSPWRGANGLNVEELPPSDVARSQHEQPMQRSQATVDDAFVAHRNK